MIECISCLFEGGTQCTLKGKYSKKDLEHKEKKKNSQFNGIETVGGLF